MTEGYATIRRILDKFMGLKLVDVTQHDQEEWESERISYVCLMFEDGSMLKFPTAERAFEMEGPAAEDAPDIPGNLEKRLPPKEGIE